VNIFIARQPNPNASAGTQPQTQAGRQQPAPVLDAPPAQEIPTWNPNQQVPPAQQTTSAAQTAAPAQAVPPAAVPALPAGSKVAKVRYQVPPLARVLNLRIMMSDQSGSRILREQPVRGGEYVTLDVPYLGGATLTVQLGDRQVWQERYN
jgi:serine/threonine-protein kinase